MYTIRKAFVLAGLLLTVSGCGSTQFDSRSNDELRAFHPEPAHAVSLGNTSSTNLMPTARITRHQSGKVVVTRKPVVNDRNAKSTSVSRNGDTSHVKIVGYQSQADSEQGNSNDATVTINGKTYRLQLVSEPESPRSIQTAAGVPNAAPMLFSSPVSVPTPENNSLPELLDISFEESQRVPLDLPTALGMVGGQHPAVGFARWRVQEAYAQLDRAEVLWLPSLQTGFNYHRHDGNTQTTSGSIVDLNRNSFQYGLGTGANAAGTTPNPGIVARFHLSDAIFQPEIAEKTAWARGHAAEGVVNEQLLNVAVAYLELLNAEQDLRIVEESRERTFDLSKLTSDYAATGQGLQSDADRLQTELGLVENRLASARERTEVASARLTEALSIDAGQQIVPVDPAVTPIELVSRELDKATLITTGLSNRPELREAQTLVVAAQEAFKREKYAPFVPSVLLGFSTGEFGGGLGNSLNNVDNRYDFDAMMTWEVRNLGFGEGAARRESKSRIEQARFEQIRTMDRVAREISEAHSQVTHRTRRIEITRNAIQAAQNSYDRNLSRIRDAQGLPLEALQSLRALEDARRAYLQSVIDYNEAQFRLQWSLGWSIAASSESYKN